MRSALRDKPPHSRGAVGSTWCSPHERSDMRGPRVSLRFRSLSHSGRGRSPGLRSSQRRMSMSSHSRGAICVRVLCRSRPRITEGAGNAGCTPHPLPCVQNKKDARRPTQVRRNHSGTPCAMALRLTPRSPWCPGSLATIAAQIAFHNLIPASGDQDHTA